MANEQKIKKNSEQQTRALPKNFRQIGDPGTKKIYMEDYVYTYLNKLAQPGNLYARGAILFGNTYQTSVGQCLFISGAAACQNFEFDLEESVFTEENWSEIYRIRDNFFPEMEIVGWFLSRMGFSVELNDKIIRTHMDNFSGENKVLYMIDALENEDAFYQFENYSLKKQRGYYIYYETNQEMKNYMLMEGETEHSPEDKRKSATILRDSSVVRNYKKAMKQKKSLHKKTAPKFGPASLAGVLVMIMVLFYGVRSVQQFRQEENAEAVFQQQTLDNQKADNSMETDSSESVRETGNKADSEGVSSTAVSAGNSFAQDESGSSTEIISSAETTENYAGSSEENRGRSSTTSRAENETDGNMKDTDSERGVVSEGTSSTENDQETNADIFTQEEPDDVTESWSYIGNQYTVRQGDTLAGISMKIYQSYDYIDALAEANQIENLDEIYPGQVLNIPPMED